MAKSGRKFPAALFRPHLRSSVPRGRSTGELIGQDDGLKQGGSLVDRLLILGCRHRIGDDAGTGLDMHLAVLNQCRAESYAGIEVAVVAEIPERAGVAAALRAFHL